MTQCISNSKNFQSKNVIREKFIVNADFSCNETNLRIYLRALFSPEVARSIRAPNLIAAWFIIDDSHLLLLASFPGLLVRYRGEDICLVRS